MGKVTGFLEIERIGMRERPVDVRKEDWREVYDVHRPVEELRDQGARCMDCGIPFCQGDTGCPLGNIIPDWNDLAYRDDWEEGLNRLHATNNFPEVTGRVCPAPCEQACTLNINDDPVTIKQIERSLADIGWERGTIHPQPPKQKSGKSVAVVGSGPAGMAAAQQLARAGHDVTLYEKADRIGGLLRYGIPDFKMAKDILDRRMRQMEAEGVVFKPGVHVGVDVPASEVVDGHDAVLLACGSEQPRDLPIPGRELNGVHFAMEFLTQQNRRGAGDTVPEAEAILATDKRVVVLGGGDTGSDCIGTSHRQDAAEVLNFELLPKPPESRGAEQPWPWWPYKLFTSSSHEEGGKRDWSVMTKRFIDDGQGNVAGLEAVRVEFSAPDEHGRRALNEVPGSEFTIECDLVLLALGFVHPVREGLIEQLGLELSERGNVATGNDWQTSIDKVFCAGDMTRGQSLVVWAISDGRRAARGVDAFLMGQSELPAGPRRKLPDMLKKVTA